MFFSTVQVEVKLFISTLKVLTSFVVTKTFFFFFVGWRLWARLDCHVTGRSEVGGGIFSSDSVVLLVQQQGCNHQPSAALLTSNWIPTRAGRLPVLQCTVGVVCWMSQDYL